ncbi:glycosyl transferase [Martelella mediterranea]|uniref:Glycosyl transferase family 2 n=1 Tax=Martelella mediterranea TaxID=293089 RepID=A0A4R3NSR7_9HYPH|nr:glycosyl transferase [Martelella mediterranea]TCT39823.1 hypothetical protein EDC90_10115 [Martelella mediterranea]
MLSVIIECDDNEPELAHTLSSLVVGAVEGLISDVTVLDRRASEGTSLVAEAAGCRYFRNWDLTDVVTSARGDWILVLEPGARPLSGWVDAIHEHIATETKPARFSKSRRHRRAFWKRLFTRRCPLEAGLLLPKPIALEKARECGTSPFAMAHRMVTRRLSCELIPASAMPRLR